MEAQVIQCCECACVIWSHLAKWARERSPPTRFNACGWWENSVCPTPAVVDMRVGKTLHVGSTLELTLSEVGVQVSLRIEICSCLYSSMPWDGKNKVNMPSPKLLSPETGRRAKLWDTRKEDLSMTSPSVAILRVWTLRCLGKTIELPLVVWEEENWPCFLLSSTLHERAMAELENWPGWWRWGKTGRFTNPATTQVPN